MDGLDVQGQRAVPRPASGAWPAELGGWQCHSFTEIRHLEKDQAWEGRSKVWFPQFVNEFVTG